jgi:hypothetical protein
MIYSLIELTIFLAHDQVSFDVQTIGLNRGVLTAFCVNQGKRLLRKQTATTARREYFLKDIEFFVKLPANTAGRQFLPTFECYWQSGRR